MPKIWSSEMIRELLALAGAQGSAQAELANAREAALFRFAIYTFRRKNRIGNDISITIEDNKVMLVKRPEIPTIKILQEQVA